MSGNVSVWRLSGCLPRVMNSFFIAFSLISALKISTAYLYAVGTVASAEIKYNKLDFNMRKPGVVALALNAAHVEVHVHSRCAAAILALAH